VKQKISNKFLFLIFCLIIFSLNIFQSQVEHWSNDFDQNTAYIYNIIELNTGYYQTDINHPAYTTYSLNVIILNIIKFFDSNLEFTINNFSFLNLDSYLSRVFFYSRIINTLFGVLLIYYLIKILKIYKTNSLVITGLIFILLSYSRYLELILVLRSDTLCIALSLCSFYYATKFKKSKKQYHFILSGFFFLFAMLAKIQIIFFFIIFLFLILIFLKKISLKNIIFFIFGIFFAVFFIYILDLFNLIKFNPNIINKIIHPIDSMAASSSLDLKLIINKENLLDYNFYFKQSKIFMRNLVRDVFGYRKYTYNISGFIILLIYFYYKKKDNNKFDSSILILLIGFFFLILTQNFRSQSFYNIYSITIYCLLLSHLTKNNSLNENILFFFLSIIIFISELDNTYVYLKKMYFENKTSNLSNACANINLIDLKHYTPKLDNVIRETCLKFL
jgi:hypothetical protein